MRKRSDRSLFMKRSANIFRHQGERVRRYGQQLDYTLADLRELAEPCLGLPCPFCQALLTPGNFSIDHADPASRRGSFARDNLIVCCLRCNQTKGPLTEEEF